MYALTIRSKTIEEAFQIVEQVISAFDPQVSVHLLDSKDLEIDRDITVKLESGYSLDDNYENSQEDVRFIEINLSFTVKGYIYKRTNEVPIVLEVSVNGQIGDGIFNFGTVAATPLDIAEISNLKQLKSLDDALGSIQNIGV